VTALLNEAGGMDDGDEDEEDYLGE
jgi:hypothetical protein